MRNLGCLLGVVFSFLSVAEAGAANFVHLDTIAASDAAANDEFGGFSSDGVAVSTDGSTLLVASWLDDCAAGSDCGSAYVFKRTPGGWVQQAKLTAPDASPGDRFMAVALSGDGSLALVGAYGANCTGGGLDCGAVYSFVRNGTAWSFQQKLTASDGSVGDTFGIALDISSDGTVALVGAHQDSCGAFFGCGAVYAFERSGGVWTERQKLRGDPASSTFFGGEVVLSGDGTTALIDGDVFGGLVAARAYVFTRHNGVWSFQTKLEPLGSPFVFAFNMEVSADGNVALVHQEEPHSLYVFTRTGTVWSLETQLFDSTGDGELSGTFALSDDGRTVAALRFCNNTPCQAATLVFRRDWETWRLEQSLSQIGTVDLSGDAKVLLLGDAQASCASGSSCGVAHVFGRSPRWKTSTP